MRVDDADACADDAIRRVGNRIVLGLPLDLGKPLSSVNALNQRAKRDPRSGIRSGFAGQQTAAECESVDVLLQDRPFCAQLTAAAPVYQPWLQSDSPMSPAPQMAVSPPDHLMVLCQHLGKRQWHVAGGYRFTGSCTDQQHLYR